MILYERRLTSYWPSIEFLLQSRLIEAGFVSAKSWYLNQRQAEGLRRLRGLLTKSKWPLEHDCTLPRRGSRALEIREACKYRRLALWTLVTKMNAMKRRKIRGRLAALHPLLVFVRFPLSKHSVDGQQWQGAFTSRVLTCPLSGANSRWVEIIII